jgi:urease accessory protein
VTLRLPDSGTLALLLADSRLPSGGHVTSNGLESALRAGMPPARVREYMMTRIETVVPVEAGTAVVARHALVAGGESDPGAALAAVDAEWAARTPSAAQREIARALGAGLARLARTLWPRSPVAQVGDPLSRATVIGAIAAATGMRADDLVRVVAYDDAQTVAAALLKLEPLDPAIPVGWVLDACAHLEPRVDALAALTRPDAIPASGAPQIELWAEAHPTLPRRLFRA